MKNNRTFLEKLLDGAKVEWKPLKKVCNFISTGKLNANAMDENGIYPFFTCNEKPYKINNYAFDMEAILISGNGSQVGHLNYFKGKFNAYQRTYVIGEFDNNTLAMYLYHYLNFKLRDYITINSKKGSVPYITLPMLEKFEIPIPPLPVQTEIVKILDALTALTSELTSELTLRRKQYEYYREKLLSEEELGKVGFEWRALKDILIRTKGTKITAAEMKVLHKENAPLKIFAGGKTFALVNYSDIPEKDINKNPSIIVKSRGIIEFEYYDKPFSHKNEMWSYYSNDKNINIKYIYYILKNQEPYFQSLGSKMQMPQIAIPDTDKYLVPIPPPYIQTEIVKVLDKFVNLTNSISEGLPLAIEQSHKRYEYYRELLLSF